ncbi:hypothetical protein ACFSTE_07525 [Aquimarina hainanensis]|uniref:PAP2 superfamily protein n=1 Tax=Aquimarina hainanensis TaxID=1578017 RepID=A0ABW5N562_9FLAO|nr:hypothetical protein [Aquimarina sp. TRL1]QKX05094.1 hypothetical protein HN014_09240 [Aquimarina sp. TRL1]
MNALLKSFSYILHPIIMPILGAIIYFSNTPRFFAFELVQAKLIGLFIMTVCIPVILFFSLKNLGLLDSFHLATVNQRKIPLILQSFILLLVIKIIIDAPTFPELYFFFLGALISAISATFIVLFNIKASLHMIGISSITMFTIALSVHFGINITTLIGLLFIGNGALATSRLIYKAHTHTELILGISIGMLPQLILVNFWL